jgi:hypothetical protein
VDRWQPSFAKCELRLRGFAQLDVAACGIPSLARTRHQPKVKHLTPDILKSERIRRGLVRWGLFAAMLCVGLAAWTGYAAGHDVFDSMAFCIFTTTTIAVATGLSWLLIPIIAGTIRHRRDRRAH